MNVYDILILLFIAFLVGWAIWDYRRRKNQKRFVFTLLTLAPILISLASLLFGLWGCHKIKNEIEKFFGKTVIKNEQVVSVESGNIIKLHAGIRKGARRTKQCTLFGLLIPPEVEPQAKANLESMVAAGDEIRVEIREGAEGWMADKFGNISGIPFAKNGDNCCLAQLKAGLATSTIKDAAFDAAQAEAKKAHKGIWAKKTKSDEGDLK